MTGHGKKGPPNLPSALLCDTADTPGRVGCGQWCGNNHRWPLRCRINAAN